jgi:hypothetical protein
LTNNFFEKIRVPLSRTHVLPIFSKLRHASSEAMKPNKILQGSGLTKPRLNYSKEKTKLKTKLKIKLKFPLG